MNQHDSQHGKHGDERHEHGEKPQHTITYYVDDVPQITSEHELTANQILTHAGKSPEQYYLISLQKKVPESYRDRGNEKIKLHKDDRFITGALGGGTVSDAALENPARTGFAGLVAGLRELGYVVTDHGKERLSFPFEVPCGKHMGLKATIGLVAHGDWPNQPPSGPHVSPRILPISPPNAPKTHPLGGVHDNSPFGSDFQYWSRPFPDWPKTERTAAAYMAFIRALWDTV